MREALGDGWHHAQVLGRHRGCCREAGDRSYDKTFDDLRFEMTVGEKFVRACESAAEREAPLISVTASGGARMQEGILSLMQLPKTVCAVEDLHDRQVPVFSVMAHPTTGGVLASFASLGDVLIAEPGALMSFAGPRVVERTTREKLPADFGTAEQNELFGHIDAIVPRPEQHAYLSRLLRLFDRG